MWRRWLLLALVAAGCGDDSGLPDAPLGDGKPLPGTFSLSWTLQDSGTPVTCEQARASIVSVELNLKGSLIGFFESFSCSSARSTSRKFDPGTYELKVTLTGAGGSTVATVPTISDVVIRSNQDTAVPPIVFEVDVPPAPAAVR